MPDPPKEKTKEDEKPDREAWSDDQENRRYYYDDAHGYKEYDPEKDEDDEFDD